jgi:hypothetical protein
MQLLVCLSCGLIVLVLQGCALAIGDGSRADVNVNNTPSIDLDSPTEESARRKKP